LRAKTRINAIFPLSKKETQHGKRNGKQKENAGCLKTQDGTATFVTDPVLPRSVSEKTNGAELTSRRGLANKPFRSGAAKKKKRRCD
jgi:hypothetical protein